jgi:hypothetical protein
MKRILILFSFLTLNFISFSQSNEVDKWRRDHYLARQDSSSCAKLYQKITKENSTYNTIICYRGAITATMADYSKNKLEKLNLFKEGKKLIEQSIAKDTNNAELRFLRFTIQTNCPKILGYNKQIDADKMIILKNISAIKNQELKKSMNDFLLHSPYLSPAEKLLIK